MKMSVTRPGAALLIAILALALASCSGGSAGAESTTASTTDVDATAVPTTEAASTTEANPATTPATTAAAAESGWSFTDMRGREVVLDAPPERIVADTYSAGSLWDFGIRPVGVFGWGLEEEESSWVNSLGNVDLDQVEVVGVADQINLEQVAALNPDLIVGNGPLEPSDPSLGLQWVSEQNMQLLDEMAPSLATEWYNKSLDEILVSYEDLAAALGADVDAPELVEAKENYEAAKSELAEVAQEKDLTLMVVTAGPDGIWVANPPFGFVNLQTFTEMGMDLVIPENPEGPWELLAWENVDTYHADVILFVGESPLETGVLDDQPTWQALPAVEAEQVVSFNDKWPYSYVFYADALSGLADSLSGFESLD